MGKAAKFKKIRRLAAQLPELQKNVLVTENIMGSELPEGTKDVDGKDINKNYNYKSKKVATVNLNHNKMMKRIYNKHGLNAVDSYANAVVQISNARKSKI